MLQIVLYRSFTAVITFLVSGASANSASAQAVIPARVFFSECMSALAMRLRSLIGSVLSNGFCKRFLVSGIQRLFLSGRPSAILRRVVTIIVATIQRQPIWSRTHIGNEGTKPIASLGAPTFANRDSASAPVFEIFVFGAVAARNHVRPCAVQGVIVDVHGTNYTPVTTGEQRAFF